MQCNVCTYIYNTHTIQIYRFSAFPVFQASEQPFKIPSSYRTARRQRTARPPFVSPAITGGHLWLTIHGNLQWHTGFGAKFNELSFSGWWLSHLPLWKMMEWVRQLGWFFIPKWMESHNPFHGSSHHQPDHHHIPIVLGLYPIKTTINHY